MLKILMWKKIKKYLSRWIKAAVKEKNLKNEPLEHLLILKDDERDYFSVKFPTFINWLWTVISVFIAVLAKTNQRQGNNIILSIFLFIAVFFIIRLRKLFHDIDKNNEITNYNLKIYDKIISKKIKEKQKSEKEYKEKIVNLLEKISENTK